MDQVFNRTRKIPNKSWGQECSLCSSKHGVPIECSARGCKAAYHTTCAIRGKLKMQAIFGKNYKGGIKLRSYCKLHSPSVKTENGISSQADKIDANGVKEIDMTNLVDDCSPEANEELDFFWKYVDINEVHKNLSEAYARAKRISHAQTEDDEASDKESTPKKSPKKSKMDNSPSKKSQALKKPKVKIEKEADDKANQEVDPMMLDLIYRYWMLLRTANNGQSLIKFSPSALKEREHEQRKSILKLRIELERVRNLSYMIGKREKLKATWLKTHQNIIKRTFSVINDLNPIHETLTGFESSLSDQSSLNHHTSSHNQPPCIPSNGKKFSHPTQHLQPTNGMFDESDQLIHDLISCDQIYETPISSNSNYSNLSHQEQSTLERRRTLSLVRRINRQLKSTLERRRTLSLVRRINRQLKSVSVEPSLNPYAKSYLVPKRSDSPIGTQQPSAAKLLKNR